MKIQEKMYKSLKIGYLSVFGGLLGLILVILKNTHQNLFLLYMSLILLSISFVFFLNICALTIKILFKVYKTRQHIKQIAWESIADPQQVSIKKLSRITKLTPFEIFFLLNQFFKISSNREKKFQYNITSLI